MTYIRPVAIMCIVLITAAAYLYSPSRVGTAQALDELPRPIPPEPNPPKPRQLDPRFQPRLSSEVVEGAGRRTMIPAPPGGWTESPGLKQRLIEYVQEHRNGGWILIGDMVFVRVSVVIGNNRTDGSYEFVYGNEQEALSHLPQLLMMEGHGVSISRNITTGRWNAIVTPLAPR